jgi:hypothetical protein
MTEAHQTEEQQLKACPFCQSALAPEALSEHEMEDLGDCDCDCHANAHQNFAVCCCANSGGCGAIGGFEISKRAAIKKWNARGAT